MKTAIILNGNIRTWEQTKNNFKDTFSSLDYDVYVSTYDRQWGYHPHIKNVTQYFEDVILTNDQIKDMFSDCSNVVDIDIEDAQEVDNHANQLSNSFSPFMHGLLTSFCQFRKTKLAVDSIIAHEEKNNFKYDQIIKTRCDLMYNPTNFIVQDNEVLLDSGNVYPNDCIYLIKRDKFIDVINFIMNEFFNPVYSDSNKEAPHYLLKNALYHNKLEIRSEKIMNYVQRINGPQHY